MKKRARLLLSLALTAMLCAQPFVYPVYAQVQTQEEAREKIDSSLLARLDEMEDADTIDVSVWVTDIDHEQTEENTQQALEAKVQRGETGRDVLTLAEAAQSVKENAKATRSASVDTDLQALDEISPEDAQTYIETKRAAASAEYEKHNKEIFDSLFPKEKQGLFRTTAQTQPEVLYACRYVPNIVMTLTKAQVYEIAQSSEVETIYNADEPQDDTPALTEDGPQDRSAAAAAAGNISLAYQTITGVSDMRIYNHASGAGVKIGQIELSTPDFSNPVFDHMRDEEHPENNRFHILMDVSGKYANKSHETAVASIIVGKSTGYTGIAPDAEYYAVGIQDFNNHKHHWRKGMELLIDAGVNVINASYEFTGEARGTYGEPSRWVDHVINEHDVSVCISAGNDRYILGGAMAYNAITVGDIDDNHTLTLSDDKRMVNDDDLNKQSAYSLNTELAYKPDIMAPGATAGTPIDPQTNTNHGGTSYSAPIVTGAVAQLCDMFPAYKTMPLVLKAILLAGAVKTQEMIDCDEDTDPDNDIDSVIRGDRIALDRKNGAGMVNVVRASSVISDHMWFYLPSFGKNSKMQLANASLESGSRAQICLLWPKQNAIHGPHYPPDGSGDSPTPVYEVPKETLLLNVYDSRPMMIYESFYQKDTKEYIAFEPYTAGQYSFRVYKISNPYVTGVPVVIAWFQL